MQLRAICIGAGALLSAMAAGASGSGGEVNRHTTAAAPAGTAGIQGGFSMNPAQKAAAGYERMDNTLAGIAEQAATLPRAALVPLLHASAAGVRYRLHDPLVVPNVLVDIQVKGDPAAAQRALEQLGVEQLSRYSNLISGYLPADRLRDAAALDGVRFLRASRAATRTGSITSQGDIIQRSDRVRASTFLPGLTGAGMNVGILSDSFACATAVTSYSQDVASGDLPANVNILEEYNATQAGVTNPATSCDGATDEGRAIAQIVYDVAPGTKLSFHTAFNGEADFANGIVALANAGATIIDDDVGYFDEPVFQDGIVAQAVDSVKARGIPYFSSAGNSARQSYEASFADSGTVGAAGAANAGEKLMGFTPTAGGAMQNWLPFSVPAGFQEALYLILEWDQPFVTGAPNSGGATSQMDICFTDGTGAVMTGGCSGANVLNGDPVSIPNPLNTDGSTTAYGLQIGVANGTPAPQRIKVIFADDGGGTQVASAFATNSPTVQGHPGAAGAAAVGASDFRHNPVCMPGSFPNYTLEDFSSAGGDPILFDVNGKKLATPVTRQKPLLVAPDGGNTTFFSGQLGAVASSIAGCSNAAGTYNFFGTSAAAPHAAGVAALLMQALPSATPDQIYNALASTAILGMAVDVPRSASNPVVQNAVNYDSGNGFIQADKALAVLATRVLTVNPGALAFGNQRVGTTSNPQGATVTNSGTLAVAIASITVSGPFTQSNNCPATLAPQASCQLSASAAPTAMGAASGSISIASNDSNGTDGVSLSVIGQAPVATLSGTTAAFGQVEVGKAATAQNVTLSNSGTAQLDISGITLSGSGFTQSNTCPAALAPGVSCVITLGFVPTAAQAYSGAVSIASDGFAGSQSQISLSGTGTQPVATLSSKSVDFGQVRVGNSVTAPTVTLSNTGTAPLNIGGITLGGGGSSSYTQHNNCGASLAAGASCTISMAFAPADAVGYPGSVTVASDGAAGSDSQITLNGQGVESRAVLSPTALSFGNVQQGNSTKTQGTQQVTLTNSGNATLNISGIAVGDPAFTQSNTCGASLAAGASCSINVDFSPSAAQTYNTRLTLSSDTVGGNSQVALSGNGTAPSGGGAIAPWLLLPGVVAALARRRKRAA